MNHHPTRSCGPVVQVIVLLLFRRGSIAVLFIFLLAPAAAQNGTANGIPSFDGNAGWVNGPALQPSDLHGKIVLVDFWEYTCVNCLRTLPYLKAWYERYRDDGLVIVGVHTPEFPFSGEARNVNAATKQLGVAWPVVLDDKDAIWHRYKNDAWPHEYLYDQDGRLVESVGGEGNYQTTEKTIQALVRSHNPQLALPPVMALLPEDSYDKPGALCYPRTPEVLVGSTPIADAPSFDDASTDERKFSDSSTNHRDGAIYLDGTWHVTRQAVVSQSIHASAALRYHAIEVVGVLTPENGKSVRVDVTQDGAPVPKADAGRDLHFDARGASYVTVDSWRAYDLVMNSRFGNHDLQLQPQDSGVGLYSFAFESCEAPKSS